MNPKKIKSALISVFYKDGLEPIVQLLNEQGVKIYSTGGTEKFIRDLGIDVIPVESVTEYPSIFGGRVKTLHPKIFGGILHRRENATDLQEAESFEIPPIDLVIVDLYPFEETVASGADEDAIIEKIDIGGIALIRGAAKNFNDVLIVPSVDHYAELENILKEKNGTTEIEDRRKFAAYAFNVSSHYDSAIFNFFNQENYQTVLKNSLQKSKSLRYGENPHQKGSFFGDLDALFEQLNGKELSYNNLLDVDAAIGLIDEFEDTTVAVIKHNNACGLATASNVKDAYLKALAGDPVSAFGGIIVSNRAIDLATAEELHKLFFEILIAPEIEDDALTLLKEKKNRIILKRKNAPLADTIQRTLLNGVLVQDKDVKTEVADDLKVVTKLTPSDQDIQDMLFANKIVKHTKSNAIVLVKDNQMIASGVGQTSRVDALKQAIEKAQNFGFEVEGSAMASDAFFPFPDCVEISQAAGVKSIIQPGGSIKDQNSIDKCDELGVSMVMTGTRHFKH